MSKPSNTTAEPMSFNCTCGKRGQVLLQHYDGVRCTCGKRWWALRPLRNGPLRLFPRPDPISQENFAG